MKNHWKLFIPNPPQNPFAKTVQEFFNRQLYLEANATVILHLKNEADISFGHVFFNLEEYYTMIDQRFEISPSNVAEHQKLRNYLWLNLLAQSVGNFELFLKQQIREFNTVRNMTGSKL